MKENGNEVKTTFWEDFSIAERFDRHYLEFCVNGNRIHL